MSAKEISRGSDLTHVTRLAALLEAIIEGTITAQEAAPHVRRIILAAPGIPADETMEQKALRQMEDKDPTNTFTEVVGLWAAGKISQADYTTLYEAIAAPNTPPDEQGSAS